MDELNNPRLQVNINLLEHLSNEKEWMLSKFWMQKDEIEKAYSELANVLNPHFQIIKDEENRGEDH